MTNDKLTEQSLPISMTVSDVAQFMGISQSTAYKLVKTSGFPVVQIPHIRRVVISREQFLKWYHRQDIE